MKLSVQEIKLPGTCQNSFDGQVIPASPCCESLNKAQENLEYDLWQKLPRKGGGLEQNCRALKSPGETQQHYTRGLCWSMLLAVFRSSAKKLLFRSLSKQPAFSGVLSSQLLCWNQFIKQFHRCPHIDFSPDLHLRTALFSPVLPGAAFAA